MALSRCLERLLAFADSQKPSTGCGQVPAVGRLLAVGRLSGRESDLPKQNWAIRPAGTSLPLKNSLPDKPAEESPFPHLLTTDNGQPCASGTLSVSLKNLYPSSLLSQHAVFSHFVIQRHTADAKVSGGVRAAEIVSQQRLFNHLFLSDLNTVLQRFAPANGKEPGH